MKKVKRWGYSYSIRFVDGSTEEVAPVVYDEDYLVEAPDIMEAILKISDRLPDPRKDPRVEEVVLWNVSILDDDVF